MDFGIECTNSYNEKYMAHEISAKENFIIYKCGACSNGDILFDRKKEFIFNIRDDKCNVCRATIKIKKEKEKDLP